MQWPQAKNKTKQNTKHKSKLKQNPYPKLPKVFAHNSPHDQKRIYILGEDGESPTTFTQQRELRLTHTDPITLVRAINIKPCTHLTHITSFNHPCFIHHKALLFLKEKANKSKIINHHKPLLILQYCLGNRQGQYQVLSISFLWGNSLFSPLLFQTMCVQHQTSQYMYWQACALILSTRLIFTE